MNVNTCIFVQEAVVAKKVSTLFVSGSSLETGDVTFTKTSRASEQLRDVDTDPAEVNQEPLQAESFDIEANEAGNTTVASERSVEESNPPVILVISARHHFEQRSAIRETWARGLKYVHFIVAAEAYHVPEDFRSDPSMCQALSEMDIPEHVLAVLPLLDTLYFPDSGSDGN